MKISNRLIVLYTSEKAPCLWGYLTLFQGTSEKGGIKMSRNNKEFYTYLNKFRKLKLYPIVLYSLLSLVLFAMMYNNVTPEKMNVKIAERAEQTIRAPQNTIDKEKTEALRNEAANAVESVYEKETDKPFMQAEKIQALFESIVSVQNEALRLESQQQTTVDGEEPAEPIVVTESDKLDMLKGKLRTRLGDEWNNDFKIADEELVVLINASTEQLSVISNATVTAMHNAMQKDILTPTELESAKTSLEREMGYTVVPGDRDNQIRTVGVKIGTMSVVQNKFFDSKLTQEKRQAARDAIEPVEIAAGQILVQKGDTITREIYRQLEVVGLLNADRSFTPYIGLSLLIGLIISSLVYIFHVKDTTNLQKNNSYLTMYILIFTVTLILMKVIALFQQFDGAAQIGFIAPVAMGAMLAKILINERVAILTSIILGLCGSIIYNEFPGTMNYTIGTYLTVSAIAGVLFLSQHNRRSTILQAGLFISLINIITIVALLGIKNSNIFMVNGLINLGTNLTMAIGSGIVAAVLTIGLLPFFEVGFGMLSTMKLLELSNPNHPLLRKILMEAPGTYHHSVMVANLSESACESIGANGLLARVAAYYHDVGKTKRPGYFIENQMGGTNPHDKLPPQTSKNIIIAHATDGAEILQKHNIPKEIVDIAAEHHGTTLLKFFYYKAKEQNEELDEKEYRYPGPKAQTKEAAIVGTADSIEAAVRSLNSPTPEKIESIVKSIIKDRLQDGQFSECDLTFKELEIMTKSFCETLSGIFHSRIEYPDDKKENEN